MSAAVCVCLRLIYEAYLNLPQEDCYKKPLNPESPFLYHLQHSA